MRNSATVTPLWLSGRRFSHSQQRWRWTRRHCPSARRGASHHAHVDRSSDWHADSFGLGLFSGKGCAAISEKDDVSLIVTCAGKSKILAIVFHEPRANWQRGEQTEVLVASDAGDYRQLPLSGNVMGRTVVAVRDKNAAVADADVLTTYADETAEIVSMGQAQKSLSITVGGYTRSFSASNLHDAVEPVLRQCGLCLVWVMM